MPEESKLEKAVKKIIRFQADRLSAVEFKVLTEVMKYRVSDEVHILHLEDGAIMHVDYKERIIDIYNAPAQA